MIYMPGTNGLDRLGTKSNTNLDFEDWLWKGLDSIWENYDAIWETLSDVPKCKIEFMVSF